MLLRLGCCCWARCPADCCEGIACQQPRDVAVLARQHSASPIRKPKSTQSRILVSLQLAVLHSILATICILNTRPAARQDDEQRSCPTAFAAA
jgi:hypothetical protein